VYHKTNILETFFNIFAAQKKKDSSEMLSSTFIAQKKKDSSEMLSSTFVAQKKKDSSEMLSSTFVAQDKTTISAMLFLYVQRRAAQQCVQRTPLARPLTWARFFGVVACCRSSRSTEVASGAADAWRWAAPNKPNPLVCRCHLAHDKVRSKVIHCSFHKTEFWCIIKQVFDDDRETWRYYDDCPIPKPPKQPM